MPRKLIVIITLAAIVLGYALPASAQRKGRRMKQVDLLVLGGTLVSMDKERRIVPDAGIAVLGGRIVAVGSRFNASSWSCENCGAVTMINLVKFMTRFC